MNSLPPPTAEYEYRAIGFVRASFSPGEESFGNGKLILEDGTEVPSVIYNKCLIRFLETNSEVYVGTLQNWTVYPKTQPELRFQIKFLRRTGNDQAQEASEEDNGQNEALRAQLRAASAEIARDIQNDEELHESLEDEELNAIAPIEEDINYLAIDETIFSIRGALHKWNVEEQEFYLQIKRNKKDKKGTFLMRVKGQLENYVKSAFLEISCGLLADNMTLQSYKQIGILPSKPSRGRKFGGTRPDFRRERPAQIVSNESGKYARPMGPKGGNEEDLSPEAQPKNEGYSQGMNRGFQPRESFTPANSEGNNQERKPFPAPRRPLGGARGSFKLPKMIDMRSTKPGEPSTAPPPSSKDQGNV